MLSFLFLPPSPPPQSLRAIMFKTLSFFSHFIFSDFKTNHHLIQRFYFSLFTLLNFINSKLSSLHWLTSWVDMEECSWHILINQIWIIRFQSHALESYFDDFWSECLCLCFIKPLAINIVFLTSGSTEIGVDFLITDHSNKIWIIWSMYVCEGKRGVELICCQDG